MAPYLFNKFKKASGKPCEIWLKLRLQKHMATFQTLQTWIDHVARFEKLPDPLVTVVLVILNVLPHITKLYKHE